VIKIWESPLENSGESGVFAVTVKSIFPAIDIEANLFSFSKNPKLIGFSTKVSVWVFPENSAGFVNSNSNFDRGKLAEIPWMAKLNSLELSMLETLSMMKLLVDQALFETLNVSEKVPC
jgi:hypothetical protein